MPLVQNEDARISDEELLNDIRRVAEKTAPRRPRVEDYREHGDFSYATVHSRFASWVTALERASLPPGPGEGEIVRDISRVYHGLGRRPSKREYQKYGEYSANTVASMFGMGDWVRAMESFEI